MQTSFVYKSAFVYELVMRGLYGRHYSARYQAISQLIPDDSTVLDVCCGPAMIYRRFLQEKGVQYTGLDINKTFIDYLVRKGIPAEVSNVQSNRHLPPSEFTIMQASLYHFLPDDAYAIVDRMIESATKAVIIAEPIRNLTNSTLPLISWIGKHFTNAGSGVECYRFTEKSLDEFFQRYESRISQSFVIPGGREKVYVLNAQEVESGKPECGIHRCQQ